MAVSPEQIEAILRASISLYRAAEWRMLLLITRYLQQGLDGAGWAESRLADLAALRRAAEGILGQLDENAAQVIEAAVNQAYGLGSSSVLSELPSDQAARLAAQAAVAGAVPRGSAMASLTAALIRDVGERHSNVLRHVIDVYRQVIAEATSVSVAGGQTRRNAAQYAYQRLVDQGITSFVDQRGRTWRLSSYVEMAVRTVTQRAAVQGQVDRLARMGISTVIVSNEAQECERCRPFEGKVLRHDSGPVGRVELPSLTRRGETVTVDILTTLDDARSRGFQHPNCRHSVRAFLPGATRLPRGPTADPEGDKARQRQRAIERAIRRWKEREAAALEPSEAARAGARVRLWQAEMRAHLAANPTLKRLPYREQVGAGNLPG